MTAVARVAATPDARPAAGPSLRAASLRLVPARRLHMGKGPSLVILVSLLAAGLLGLLALNTVLAQDAFRLHELQSEGRRLADREQELQTAVEGLQAPRTIAERATGLGMVPGGPPAFLRLPDGVVLGAGAPASASTGSDTGVVDSTTAAPAPADAPTSPGASASSGAPTSSDPAVPDDATARSPR